MFVIFVGIIFIAFLLAVVTRGAKVDTRTGASSGCLGLLVGVIGCYCVVYQMASAGMFGRMKEDGMVMTALFYGLPSGILVGVLLGWGLAALMKRSRKP